MIFTRKLQTKIGIFKLLFNENLFQGQTKSLTFLKRYFSGHIKKCYNFNNKVMDTPYNSNNCLCHRYAFSLSNAISSPNFEKNFKLGIQAVTKEEFEKICRFRYREDSLASLAGKLILRQMAKKITGTSWDEIKFDRTERGKPFLSFPPNTNFGMNISHQGDYVAFASSCSPNVGVDCMRLDISRNNKTADEYINSMSKSASPNELSLMKTQPTDAMKMTVFYRIWCLKESILKATGQGMINDLTTIDFQINTSDRYRPGSFIKSTKVNVDGKNEPNFQFEESFIDSNHSVAVCYDSKLPKKCNFYKDKEAKIFFSKVNFDFLLQDAKILNPLHGNENLEYEEFMKKPKKTF
ncbi:L-aminoadipate-semialdehyde dehydrogenase-phosphopantetheinyl transferase [Strongyloides ratti]|uniref:L-aminoadipate-semialdehyde dehydrogenase-phosphopantetheinyl transferase n=1 Tax=Strongyloides ratti TaxID=34506 RepID=A0A090LKD2_STRRB|nr:L-aminoadipate-semialdehyde dehydrogenase-phosphopantetheinyl transferase [Strongyloides ratti]CEF68608.1 L-aminoadipate-semialdehyde dehydrogenase-phosphopantetheinyl transferase [Strongyloides ratti]